MKLCSLPMLNAMLSLKSHNYGLNAMAIIKHVGGVEIQRKHKATCHCGMVVLELDLHDGLVEAKRCNCSICRRKGAVMAYVPLSSLRVVSGAEHLALYQSIRASQSTISVLTAASTRTTKRALIPMFMASILDAWKVLIRLTWIIFLSVMG